MPTFFATDEEDLRPPPSAADEAEMARRNLRYQESRKAALSLQETRARNAKSDMPPGSPTQYLDTYGNKLGPIEHDEFGITKPAPLHNTGIRGYPTMEQISANWAAINAQDKAFEDEQEIRRAAGAYPAAPQVRMPSTDDLIDTGIQSKRNQLQNEINTRKVHLGLLPPSAIGAVATVLDSDQPIAMGRGRYAPSKAQQTRAELAILERSAGALDRAQQRNIANRSRLAIETAKQNEIAAQDNARAGVVNFISSIDEARYPHGSPEREKFIGKVFAKRPDWLHVMAKDKDLTKFVQEHVDAHTTVADTLKALKQAYPDEESLPTVGEARMVPSVTSKGGVSYRSVTSQTPEQKQQTKLAELLHKQTGLTPDEFAAIDPASVKAGGIFVANAQDRPDNRQGTFHQDAGGGFDASGKAKGEFVNDTKMLLDKKYADTPWEKVPQEEKDRIKNVIETGGAIQIDTGKGYKATIPRTLYQRYLNAFKNTGKKVMSVEEWLDSE